MIWLGVALNILGAIALVAGSAANQRADMGVRWGRTVGIGGLVGMLIGVLALVATLA